MEELRATALRGGRTFFGRAQCREIAGLSSFRLVSRIQAGGDGGPRQPALPRRLRLGRHRCWGGVHLLCQRLRYLLLRIGKQNTQRRFDDEETSKQSQPTRN